MEKYTNEIAFVADTQAPLWMERLYLKSNHNTLATAMLFDDIVLRHPQRLFILGDVVALSYSNASWKKMDHYLQNCRQTGVSVFGCLGNHEYIGEPNQGVDNFQKRFAEHLKTGYIEVQDSIAMVLLNSNFSSMTAADTALQAHWYARVMDSLDHAAGVQYILVGCHHSPYSNSKIVGSSIAVQRNFVPIFSHTHKARLFLSGHSHNFEYFRHEGKDFLVVGGGGGLHQPLVSVEKRLPDMAAGYNPMFHYLTVKRNSDHLQILSHQLKEDFSGFAEGLQFTIPKP